MTTQCRMTTGTATLAVFDPACLEHRLDDSADWWSVPSEELVEINAGNVLFVSTGADGTYDVVVSDTDPSGTSADKVCALLRCVSGNIYVGAGEEVPRPSTTYGGTLLTVQPGSYSVTVVHPVAGQLLVSIVPSHCAASNSFTASPRVEWPPEPDVPPPHMEPLSVVVASDNWTRCPNCSRRFKVTDLNAFSDGRHRRCGQPLLMTP
jgi:hypothetical protein